MWFKNVYLKTLREYRIAILGWGIGMGLVVVSPMASVAALVSSPQAREEIAKLAATYAWNAAPIALNTVGGYATWKIGTFIFLIAIWPLLAASRTLRGEEERGSLDVLLSLPLSRTRVALEKLAAIWTALLGMGLLIALVTFAGGQQFGGGFSLVDALLFSVNLVLICAVIAGVALLISQFTQERTTAAGWTAGLLLVFIVVDMVHRVIPGTGWISHFSPIYYYNLSKPLIPSYGTSWIGLSVQLGLTLILSGTALLLFARRDVGGTVPLPHWLRPAHKPRATRSLPSGDWSLRTVYSRSLRAMAWPTAWWTLGIAGFGAWIVIAVQQMESQLSKLLAGSPEAQTLIKDLGGGNAAITAGLLSALFFFLPLFLMAFAVTQVNRWSADEQEGRLELVLATPHSRVAVLLARFGALATAIVAISVVTLIATDAAVLISGLALDSGHLVAATLGMIPLALLVGAIGYLGAGWLRTSADTGLLSFLLVIWFVISFIGPELNWPEATRRLSAFYYYGTPLLHGLQTASVVGLLAVSALALAIGVARFQRKDIGT